MEENKGIDTENLIEQINSLLEKMPSILKRVEDLQIRYRELKRNGYEDSAVRQLSDLETSARRLGERISQANETESNPVSETWNEYSMASSSGQQGEILAEKEDSIPEPDSKLPEKTDATVEKANIHKEDPILRKAPDTIPPERRRRVIFLYSEDSESLLNKFLEDIDSYSMASDQNPFFVSRASVRKADNEVFKSMLETGLQAGISGIACIGFMPEDIENSFYELSRREKIAFLRADEISYSKDTVLDFLIELISIEKVDL